MFIQGMKQQQQSSYPSELINQEIHQIIASANPSQSYGGESQRPPDLLLQQQQQQQQQQLQKQVLPQHFQPTSLPLALPLTSRSDGDANPRRLLPLHDDLNDDEEEDMNSSVQSARQPMPPAAQMPSARYHRAQYS
jgi:hypothetical protein